MIYLKKKLVFFCPSIEDGGMEKNLYILVNYFATIPNYKIYLITEISRQFLAKLYTKDA